MSSGAALWASVKLDQRRERWIVYTSLRGELERSADDAFRESETILRDVLRVRLTAHNWVAVVLCGNRLSHTIGAS
jgi:hypothetical protein